MHKEIRQIIHESIIFTLRFNNNTDLYVNWSLKVILITKAEIEKEICERHVYWVCQVINCITRQKLLLVTV